jgi:dCTP deaminase
MKKCVFCDGDYNKDDEECTSCKLSNQPRLLTDWEIRKIIEMGVVKIIPVLDMNEQLSSFGFDLTLDTKFKKIIKSNKTSIDPIKNYNKDEYYESVELLLSNVDEHFILHPGEFTLGQSFEYIALPDFISAGLDGKSSLGRLSLTIHTTAGSIDPGFTGHVTFELFNSGGLPIVLRPLQPVARLVLHLTKKAENAYSGQYTGQTEVRPSEYYKANFSPIFRKQKERLP